MSSLMLNFSDVLVSAGKLIFVYWLDPFSSSSIMFMREVGNRWSIGRGRVWGSGSLWNFCDTFLRSGCSDRAVIYIFLFGFRFSWFNK